MRASISACLLVLCSAGALNAQQPTPQRRDTVRNAAADSAAAAAADSAAIAQELEKMKGPPAAGGAQGGGTGQSGSTNPRLLPDFSAVGDLVGDLSPKHSTQDDHTRFGVREVELAVQAAVDPYFRGDVFLGISDVEKISIEQAFLTTTSLPAGIEGRLGRELLPVGKQNTTHRHDLHTIEYPWVLQRFFSPDGLKGTGIYASKIFAPLGFYQELILTANDQFGERGALTTLDPANNNLGGLAFSARFRNYIDLTQNANFELSGSAITGKRAQLVSKSNPNACILPTGADPGAACVDAINARQTVVGADLTYRWRPLQQGLYRSFMLQAELMKQFNEAVPQVPPALIGFTYAGPDRSFWGGYVFARWQTTARGFLGSRFDWLQDPLSNPAGATFKAISGYYEWYPSEFSKLNLAYERLMPGGGAEGINRVLVQAAFSLGPHKPHPF